MVFSSMVFLCVFLPAVFLLYYMVPGIRAKNILLIVFSLMFYAYGEPVYVLLMIASTLMNYIFGRCIEGSGEKGRKAWLTVTVIVNLGVLAVYKYADMFISSVDSIFGLDIPLPGIELPIGISFFTFQAMSYVIDVYRCEVKAQKSYLNVLLYISFFPQLIAGPIVKYHDIQNQIDKRSASIPGIAMGLRRFIMGLAKKVLISNVAAAAADAVFSASAGEINIVSAWIGAVAYMMQIYYDFSGYSDMAIGLGHMFGFTFLENFRYPYVSVNIQEFWRRWHISLSTWFKEYLYIPLGGNRKGRVRTCLNKLIVFFATGLWHGANWTFVVWGLFHGFFLLLEEWLPVKKLPRILGHIYTLLIVCTGFVMFRADTLGQGLYVIGQMFTGYHFEHEAVVLGLNQLTPLFVATMMAAVIFMFPVKEVLESKKNRAGKNARQFWEGAGYVGSMVLLVLSVMALAGGTYNPFIYFRF